MEVSKSNQTPTMNEHSNDTLSNETINTLLLNGIYKGIPLIAGMLANAAMILELTHHLKVGAYERGENRNGQANGFRPLAKSPCAKDHFLVF
jgi:hypothetical protein